MLHAPTQLARADPGAASPRGQARVMVYTGKWFWDPDAGSSAALGAHPLWVSGYVPAGPPMPKGWARWTLWQYTDKGRVGGVAGPVDMSVFNSTQRDLDMLVGLPTGSG